MTLYLGPHFMHGGTGYADWLKAKPRIVKLCGAFPADPIPAGTFVIGRATVTNDGLSPDMGSPEGAAIRYFFDYVLPTARKNSWIKVWESHNEPAWDNGKTAEQYRADMRWYARCHAEFARLCWEHGLAAGLGAWSIGTPYLPADPSDTDFTPDDAAKIWDEYTPALVAMKNYGAIFTRHSYGALNEWEALRHRADYWAFKRLGFGNVKTAVTECAEERIFGQTPWKENPKYGGSLRLYFERYLVPLEFEFRKDSDYLIGATVFTLGTGGDAGWDSYDVASPEIGKWMQELAVIGSPAPQPPPTRPFTNQDMFNLVYRVTKKPIGMVIPADVLATMTNRQAAYTGAKPSTWGASAEQLAAIEKGMV